MRPKLLLTQEDANIIVAIRLAVATASGLTAEDLKSERRTSKLSWWRHLALYEARQRTGCTLAQIGSFFNRSDATVQIAAANFSNWLLTDPATRERHRDFLRNLDATLAKS